MNFYLPLAAMGTILVIHRFIGKMRDRQDKDDNFQKQDQLDVFEALELTKQAASSKSFDDFQM